MSYFIWVMLAAVIVGCVSAVMVILYARDGTNTTFRLVRCFAGFICSMVWIAAIADEVVGVLRVSLAEMPVPSAADESHRL